MLAALPLTSVFATWTWFVDALIVVITTTGVALVVRNLRVASWIPTAAMALALLFVLTWVFHSGHELLGLIPTPKTFAHFNELLVSAGTDMRDQGVPVADRQGLLFLSTLGIGAVAIVIDLFTMVLRRPALAGLPMLAIYSVPVAVREDSVNVLPFAAGAAGFLWLMATDNVHRVRRFGRRFTGDGRDVSAWEPSPLAAAGRRLALVGVVIAVTVPMAVPGSNAGLLDRFGPTDGSGIGNGLGRGGNGASVDLYAVLSGELNNNRTFDMVKVQTNDPNPYYLRFGVADEVTPAGFRNRRPGGGLAATANLPGPTAQQGPGVALRPYHAQVQIVALNMNTLPVYLQPTRTSSLDSSWFYDRNDQLIYSRQSSSRDKKYGFDYVRAEYSPEALREAGALNADDPIQRQYTAVPRIPEVERRLAQIISGKFTPYDKVRAIHSYFSANNGFRYSLETKSGTSGSAIVDFLNNKQGFCEQYSAAMAWLVRAAGIPARVAFGFSRGNSQSGDTWTLTNRNLHAWTEVYFERFGWVPFDATPATFVGGVDSAWAPDPNRPADVPGATAPRDDLPIPGGPDQAAAAGPTSDPRQDRFGPDGNGATVTPPASPVPIPTTLGVLAALALLLVPALWRALLRRRRRPDRIADPRVTGASAPATRSAGGADLVVADDAAAGLARRRAHAAWDELIDTMVDYRLPLDLASTPRATSEHLVKTAALDEWAATGARLLGQAEERARYARQPLRSDDLTGSLRAVRDAIRQRVSWRTRLRAAFLPASVLSRWRAAAGEATTRLTVAVSERRDSLVRVLHPRRLLPGGRR
nr:transglutaminaseTgpA domain-containing protein [Planosporangium flavigriseum]